MFRMCKYCVVYYESEELLPAESGKEEKLMNGSGDFLQLHRLCRACLRAPGTVM